MAGVFGKVSNDPLGSTGGFGSARNSSPFAPNFPTNGSVFGIPSPSSNASTFTFTFNQVSGATNSGHNTNSTHNAFGSSSSFSTGGSSFSSLYGSATASNTFGTSTPSSFLTHGSAFGGSSTGSVSTPNTFGTQSSLSSSIGSATAPYTFAFGTLLSGSSSMFGTTSIGSKGPFNSTISRGLVGVTSYTCLSSTPIVGFVAQFYSFFYAPSLDGS